MAELSKLGLILRERQMSQVEFIDLVKQRTGITYSISRVCNYVNKKQSFLSSETLKIIAFTLQVSIDDLVDDWDVNEIKPKQ